MTNKPKPNYGYRAGQLIGAVLVTALVIIITIIAIAAVTAVMRFFLL